MLAGVIKIEMQNAAGVWQDVTLEILNLGIASRQWPDPADGTPNCAEPNVDAILRLQRLRDRTPRGRRLPERQRGPDLVRAQRAVRHARRRASRRRPRRRADALRRHHALHRARRAQPLALVPGRDSRRRRQCAQRERVHGVLLRSPRQPQRGRAGDRRVRLRRHRESRPTRRARRTACSTPARTTTATTSSTRTARRRGCRQVRHSPSTRPPDRGRTSIRSTWTRPSRSTWRAATRRSSSDARSSSRTAASATSSRPA